MIMNQNVPLNIQNKPQGWNAVDSQEDHPNTVNRRRQNGLSLEEIMSDPEHQAKIAYALLGVGLLIIIFFGMFSSSATELSKSVEYVNPNPVIESDPPSSTTDVKTDSTTLAYSTIDNTKPNEVNTFQPQKESNNIRQAVMPKTEHDQLEEYNKVKSSTDTTFNVPKIIWLYDDLSEKNVIRSLNLELIERYAQKGGFQVKKINENNLKQQFISEKYQEVVKYLRVIRQRAEQEYFKSGDNNQVLKELILLSLLEEHGGVYIDLKMTLTQSLDWVYTIDKQMYVNAVDREMPTLFFAFHNISKSSHLTRPYHKGKLNPYFVRSIPVLESDFMASYPHTPFISQTLQNFKLIINMKPAQVMAYFFQRLKFDSSRVSNVQQSIKSNIFELSSLMTIASKQKEYDTVVKERRLSAIDFYGVRSINSLYFAKKIQFVLDRITYLSSYYHMTKVPQEELQKMVGPLRYMTYLSPQQQFNQLLEQSMSNELDKLIYRGSFIQRTLFNGKDESWLLDMPKQENHENEQQWTNLPRHVWIYWGTGIANSTLTHQLCTRNIAAMAKRSGFVYHEVTRYNLHDYLDQKVIDKISKLYKESPHQVFEQTFSDFVRLALILKHGGIYMDSSYLLMQDLQWVLNITKAPGRQVYNRYGQQPKVLMTFNGQYGSPLFQTAYDHKYKTRAFWHLGYESNFIAAQANDQLIREWFQMFCLFHTMTRQQIKPILEQSQLGKHTWTLDSNEYLYIMDAIKCVISRKEQQLNKIGKVDAVSPGSQYYQLWSINAYFGVHKFRKHTNMELPGTEENLFLLLFPQKYVEAVVGYPQHFIKFFGIASWQIGLSLLQRRADIDKESIISKYMLSYKQNNQTMIVNGGQPTLAKQAV